MEHLTRAVLMIILTICSIQDYRRQRIGVLPVAAGILLLLPLRLLGVPGERESFTWMLKLLPGLAYLLLGVLKGDKVGYGDGLCVLMAGIALWPEELLYGLLGTLVPLGVCVFDQRRKGTWKKDMLIPYIPVLTAGIGLGILWGYAGI